jgi:serine/threonine protein kinase
MEDRSMTERWKRLSRALDELFDLEEPERSVRLQFIAAAQPDLADELRRLLAADEQSGLLDGGIVEAAPTMMSQLTQGSGAPQTAVGKRVGAYRLLERIGSGGMGEVWRGERADGEFEQIVAVKLIRPLLDSPQLRERFARERRILARLDHTHVARLLDGGVSDDGTPWYAMEFVRGIDIVRYAQENKLGARERVDLLLQVCDAVAHAQAQLVVHRDLKPSNILVDEQGRVRVLDFGIARLMDDAADLRLTGTGVRVFSPAYAAPEQIRGEPVGTAADVFALGAVLYELLCGEVPHPQRSAMPERLLADLQQETAPRPSQVLRTTAPGVTTLHPREMTGDLDTIVAAALQPEPARRYAGAAQLADDLRRWLEGRPIAARADTAGYRMRKFVVRHRLAVGSASAVLLALIAGLGLALWQAGVARDHAARADAEARRANAEAAHAQAEAAEVKEQVARVKKVKEFLVSIFLQADPLRRNSKGPLTIDAAFDSAVERAHTELADDPVLQADVFDDFGEIRTGQNRMDEAQALFEQALAVAEKKYGPDHPVVAESLVNLAALQTYRDRYLDSAPYIERAVAILEKNDGGDPMSVANALTGLSALRQQQGRIKEAGEIAHRALDINRAHQTKGLELSTALTNVGMLDANLGHVAEAEANLREAMAIIEADQGADSPRMLPNLSQLADLYYAQGKSDLEEQATQRALAIARKNFPADHAWTASALTDLGFVKVERGDFDAGLAMLRDAVAMHERMHSPRVVVALRRLGVAQHRHGDTKAALTTFTRALDLCRAAGQSEEQHCIVLRANRAQALALTGDGEQGLREAEAAHAALLKLANEGLYSERGQALQARAASLAALKRKDEALAQQDEVIAMLSKAYGPDHAETKGAITARERMR